MNQHKRRVVITGLGTYNPLGNDATTTWNNILGCKSGIAKITRFDVSDYKTQFAGEVNDFDPDEHFGRREARKMSRVTQFAAATAEQAMADARLDLDKVNRDRVGVVIGTGMGSDSEAMSGLSVMS